MSRKTILFCGNGLSGEAIPGIVSHGYDVALITEFPADRGLQHAKAVVTANSKHPEEAIRAARRLHEEGVRFDGVASLCWDCAPSVSLIAEEFRLRAVDRATAARATDKVLRSAAFEAHDVPAPLWKEAQDLKHARASAAELGYPVVVKPSGLSSAKGVRLVERPEDLEAAYSYARSFWPVGSLVLNRFVRGTEHAVEGLMVDRRLWTVAISDRIFLYERLKPHFVERGDILPSSLDEALLAEIERVTANAALALGIENGVVHGDILVDAAGRVFVLEIAARLGGPRFATEMIPLFNGTNLLLPVVQQAVGDDLSFDALQSKFRRGMVSRTIFPKPGVVRRIEGLDEASTLPGFYDFKWWSPGGLPIGTEIGLAENMWGAGYFICHGADREAAIANADRIEAAIRIETESA